jgi:hypothetical protein
MNPSSPARTPGLQKLPREGWKSVRSCRSVNGTIRPTEASKAEVCYVRSTSAPAVRFAQIADMSGRRPVVKGRFEAVVNVSSAVMSTAC